MTRVSVIIPTYGRSAFLGEAVSSVLASRCEVECLIVDDASPEPVVFSHPRVRVIRLPKNGGPAAARNAGYAASQGEFIAFLDDDDLWAPDRLEAALRSPEPGVVVMCQVRLVALEGRPAEAAVTSSRRFDGDLRGDLLVGQFPFVGQALLHRGDFEPFDPTFRTAEDREWWIRMCQKVRFVQEEHVGLVVRQHLGPRHGIDRRTRYENRLRIMDLHEDYFARYRRAAAAGWLSVGQAALLADRPQRALGLALRSICRRPSGAAVRLLGAAGRALLTQPMIR